jgi:hypothetical protein
MATTVVTCHVDSVWTEASATGRRGVPKVPVRGTGRALARVRSSVRVGRSGPVGGGMLSAASGPGDIITVVIAEKAAEPDVW